MRLGGLDSHEPHLETAPDEGRVELRFALHLRDARLHFAGGEASNRFAERLFLVGEGGEGAPDRRGGVGHSAVVVREARLAALTEIPPNLTPR